MVSREELRTRMFDATTMEDILRVQDQIVEWLDEHPDDNQIREEGEMVEMRRLGLLEEHLIYDPVAVARDSRDGYQFMLIRRQDFEAGNWNGPAQIHDVSNNRFSPIKPLQVWWKWLYDWVGSNDKEYNKALRTPGSAE